MFCHVSRVADTDHLAAWRERRDCSFFPSPAPRIQPGDANSLTLAPQPARKYRSHNDADHTDDGDDAPPEQRLIWNSNVPSARGRGQPNTAAKSRQRPPPPESRERMQLEIAGSRMPDFPAGALGLQFGAITL
jgi:hypothetical protein